jgi:hypothetical protein
MIVVIALVCSMSICEGKNRKARPPVGLGIGNAGNWIPRGPIFGAGAPDDGTFPPWYGGSDFGDDDGIGFGDGATGDFFDGGAGGDPFRESGDGFGWHNNGWTPPPRDSLFGCPDNDCTTASMSGPCWHLCECVGSYDQRRDARDGVHDLQGSCVRYWEPGGTESCQQEWQSCVEHLP